MEGIIKYFFLATLMVAVCQGRKCYVCYDKTVTAMIPGENANERRVKQMRQWFESPNSQYRRCYDDNGDFRPTASMLIPCTADTRHDAFCAIWEGEFTTEWNGYKITVEGTPHHYCYRPPKSWNTTEGCHVGLNREERWRMDKVGQDNIKAKGHTCYCRGDQCNDRRILLKHPVYHEENGAAHAHLKPIVFLLLGCLYFLW